MKRKLETHGGASGSTAAMFGVAFGAVAIGAFAIGVLAPIGRLAIRRMLIGEAALKSLHVGELSVTRLRVSNVVVSESLELPPSSTRESKELD
jgi:hypothetical protein